MEFLSPEEVAKHFKISYPLKEFKITQDFGACSSMRLPSGKTLCEVYKGYGLNGHNALDLRARTGTPCYAVASGEIKSYADNTGGITVDLFTPSKDINGQRVRLKIRYYHLLRYLIGTGQRASKGQLLALADNTGLVSTASHLHFGIKIQYHINGTWIENKSNGYRGAVNPKLFFDDNVDLLPVDRRYGKTFNWLKEWFMRFKTPSVHRALIRRGRGPLSLHNRELNALVYGGWTIEEILDPALWTNWTKDTKSFFKRL